MSIDYAIMRTTSIFVGNLYGAQQEVWYDRETAMDSVRNLGWVIGLFQE